MKHRILFLLLFSYATSQAQFASFPTPGLEHGAIYICNPWDCPSYFNFSTRYEGDTILCGITWNKFGQYVRAEQGKYYMFVDCNTEILMYDFSKNVGDTVVTGDLGALKVMEVGTFTLDNGELRKRMVMKPLQPSVSQTYTWVDGIGDIDRSFFRAFDFEGGHSQLICLRDTSGVFYHAPSPFLALDCDSLLCKTASALFNYSCSDQTYYFSNQSKNADSYYWDFGDGESSTETNPTHIYTTSGCYVVTLKAKAECLPQEDIAAKRIAVNTPFFWKKSPHEIPIPFIKMQFLDPQRGWALGDKKIWKTSDGGVHWDTVPYPGPVRTLGNLQFKDFEHGIVQILKPSSPYYSEILWTNDGINWETQSLAPSPTITALERLNDSVAVVAAHYQDIFVTKNWGQTWTKLDLPGAISLIQDFVSVGGDTVYFIGINQLIPPYNKFGFGKSYNAVDWEVQEYPDIKGARQISFVNSQQGWLSTGASIYHTQNAGQTWQLQVQTPVSVFEIAFADSLHGWACGHQTGIYATSDGGDTWEQQACARSAEHFRGLNVFSSNQGYILLDDGLYEYSAVPDTIKLCETIQTAGPTLNREHLFSIYPNPTSGELSIQWYGAVLSDAEMVLFNAQGTELMRWPAAETAYVSVAHLPTGLYFLQPRSLKAKWMGSAQKLVIID